MREISLLRKMQNKLAIPILPGASFNYFIFASFICFYCIYICLSKINRLWFYLSSFMKKYNHLTIEKIHSI